MQMYVINPDYAKHCGKNNWALDINPVMLVYVAKLCRMSCGGARIGILALFGLRWVTVGCK